jgi:hypothetical protein
MTCEYFDNDQCLVAKKLTGLEDITLLTNPAFCEYCLACNQPKALNKATASIAIGELIKSRRYNHSNPKHKNLQDFLTIDTSKGPGTELSKIVTWFAKKTSTCSCDKHIIKMNLWGPDECERRIETIIRWLRYEATIQKKPFEKHVVILMIRVAIRNARIYSSTTPVCEPCT